MCFLDAELSKSYTNWFWECQVFEEKAYLVGIVRKGDTITFGIEESLKELAQLADTAGLIVVGSTYQKWAYCDSLRYCRSMWWLVFSMFFHWSLIWVCDIYGHSSFPPLSNAGVVFWTLVWIYISMWVQLFPRVGRHSWVYTRVLPSCLQCSRSQPRH